MKRKILTIGAVAVVTLSSAFFAESAHAQPSSLQEVNAKQQEVKSKLSKAESQIADILYEIKEINEEISRLQAALEQNKEQMDKTQKKISKLEEEIDVLNERIEIRNNKLKERLSAYQENGGNIKFIEVLFGAKDPFEFISRVDAVTTITNADLELIEENERDKAVVEEKLEEQEILANELEEQQETINAQKEQEEASKAKLKKKEEKVKKEKAKLQSESSDLAALEAEIRASFVPVVAQASSGASNNGSATASNNNSSSNGNSNSTQVSKPVAYTGGGGSAISAGRQFIGRSSYSYGSKNPGAGLFDCSGFVQWAYEQEGVSLPRTARAMSGVGTKVSLSEAKPGDLVFFRGGGHVGIYLGGGKFLGSQNSTGVAVADMNSGYWKNNFDGVVRRVK